MPYPFLQVLISDELKSTILFDQVFEVPIPEGRISVPILFSNRLREDFLSGKFLEKRTLIYMTNEGDWTCLFFEGKFPFLPPGDVSADDSGIITGNGVGGNESAPIESGAFPGETPPALGAKPCGAIQNLYEERSLTFWVLLFLVFPVFLLIRRRHPRKTEG